MEINFWLIMSLYSKIYKSSFLFDVNFVLKYTKGLKLVGIDTITLVALI
jgi:hypothetical protein